jgi:hypothetical protein
LPRAPRAAADIEAAKVLAIPLQHPDISREGKSSEAGGSYPLLSLQEQRASRHSGTASNRASLHVEYNSSSGSNRISLPRSVSLDIRRSAELDLAASKSKGKEVEVEVEEEAPKAKATGYRKRGQTVSRPPVAFQQQLEAVERQKRRRDKGKGKATDVDLMAPTSIDVERGTSHSRVYQPAGRAEVPGERSRTSFTQNSINGDNLSSANSSIHGSDPGAIVNPGEDAEWGPSHPCYPHLNPHVPISSPLYQSTRIIRVRRDWMLEGDLAPTFSGLYPEVLADAGLDDGEFRRVVDSINEELIPAFNPWGWRNILDAVLGLATGWIWDDLGWTAVKGRLRRVERTLEEWNKNVEKDPSIGARLIGLRRTGYMTVRSPFPISNSYKPLPQIADDLPTVGYSNPHSTHRYRKRR